MGLCHWGASRLPLRLQQEQLHIFKNQFYLFHFHIRFHLKCSTAKEKTLKTASGIFAKCDTYYECTDAIVDRSYLLSAPLQKVSYCSLTLHSCLFFLRLQSGGHPLLQFRNSLSSSSFNGLCTHQIAPFLQPPLLPNTSHRSSL